MDSRTDSIPENPEQISSIQQPDTQGADPLLADIGEDGEGGIGEGDL
jgi:hypothetical protein